MLLQSGALRGSLGEAIRFGTVSMSATPPPPGLTESDFERIEAAVLETERGRWFLAEYARRIRETETSGLLSALGRIERTLGAFSAVEAPRSIALPHASREDQGAISLRLQSIGAMDEPVALAAPEPARPPLPASTPAGDPRLAAFAALDGLSLQERLAFFA